MSTDTEVAVATPTDPFVNLLVAKTASERPPLPAALCSLAIVLIAGGIHRRGGNKS